MKNSDEILALIKSAPDVVDALALLFDFWIVNEPEPSEWFEVKEGFDYTVIAYEASGAEFALVGIDAKELLLFVTSEGQAGIVGQSLEEFLGIALVCPYWRGLLKFSGGGKIDEMKRVVPFLREAYSEDSPDLDEKRKIIQDRLNLQLPESPVTVLHKNVAEYEGKITDIIKHGDEFESLFSKFTVESNPLWTKKIEEA